MNTEARQVEMRAMLSAPDGGEPDMLDQDSERAALIAVIESESAAYQAKDFPLWAGHWLQTPAARHWNWTPDVGINLLAGWERISAATSSAMAAFPDPVADNVRREFREFTITSEMAWVVLEVSRPDNDLPLGYSCLQQMWIMVKRDGVWLVACVSSLQPLSQRATCPVVELDSQGRVKWMNAQATSRLTSADGLMISAGRLRARTRTQDRALQSAIAWASGALGSPLKRATLRQAAATGGALPVMAQDNGDGARILCWVQPTDGMVLVTFDDASMLDQRILAASVVFGLSPAQQRLARLLIDGHDLAVAAKALAVSVNTARTQLQRIFVKTGVHTQSALVRVLLSIAPPLG
jgi:DNA-binding CsgD family transcriptional regulator